MVQRFIFAVFLTCFLTSGCANVPKTDNREMINEISLNDWIDQVAVPYLTKELGNHPRFKGEPFLLVSMDKNNIETEIDELTIQIREQILDGLLTTPGIGLIWRPSFTPWEHHTNLEDMKCNTAVKEKYYVSLDASISPVSGKLNVKIRALDIAEKRWITGFGISWQGMPSVRQEKALSNKVPDNYLLGLRPHPFDESQADLLAAYLAKNLSCLFADMELDEAIVYVHEANPANIKYFDKAFGLLKNQLARYKKVTVTDTPSVANITVLANVHEVHKGLYQVWASARYIVEKRYLPGRETEAYVLLPSATDTLLSDTQPQPEIYAKSAKVPEQGNINLCFYDYLESFELNIYPMLKTYPGVHDIQRLYESCDNTDACVCYNIDMKVTQYKKLEELNQWLDNSLSAAGARNYKISPNSTNSIKIFFTRGFE